MHDAYYNLGLDQHFLYSMTRRYSLGSDERPFFHSPSLFLSLRALVLISSPHHLHMSYSLHPHSVPFPKVIRTFSTKIFNICMILSQAQGTLSEAQFLAKCVQNCEPCKDKAFALYFDEEFYKLVVVSSKWDNAAFRGYFAHSTNSSDITLPQDALTQVLYENNAFRGDFNVRIAESHCFSGVPVLFFGAPLLIYLRSFFFFFNFSGYFREVFLFATVLSNYAIFRKKFHILKSSSIRMK